MWWEGRRVLSELKDAVYTEQSSDGRGPTDQHIEETLAEIEAETGEPAMVY